MGGFQLLPPGNFSPDFWNLLHGNDEEWNITDGSDLPPFTDPVETNQLVPTRHMTEQQVLASVVQPVGRKRKRDNTELLRKHRDEIQAVYRNNTLKKLALHMHEKHDIYLSEAEWRDQRKPLGLAKNLTRRDYAHIANWCSLAGEGPRKVIVKVRDEPKTIADVNKYLQKKQKKRDQRSLRELRRELIGELRGEELPEYITVEHPGPPGGGGSSMPKSSRPRRGSPIGALTEDQDFARHESDESSRSSYSHPSTRSGYTDVSISERSNTTAGTVSDTVSTPDSGDTSVASTQRRIPIRRNVFSKMSIPESARAFDAFRFSVEALITGERKPNYDWPAEHIFAALSSTPFVHTETRTEPLSRPMYDRSREETPEYDATRQRDLSNENQEDAATMFITRAHLVCILRGQQKLQEAKVMLDLAQMDIGSLIRTNSDQVLPVMNLLTALFESYGQRKYGIEILELAFTTWKRLRGGDELLGDSVRLMIDGLSWTVDATDDFVSRLKSVHTAFSVMWPSGDKSRSALAVKWQIAWALTQQEKWSEAEQCLRDLREKCETAKGVFLTAIMAAATLARVQFRRGHPDEARGLMDEIVKKLGTILPVYHPYYLESLTRQARFLQELKDPADAKRAEGILRTVLEIRQKILGPNNRKSLDTLKQLQKLLKEMGREPEADDLRNTITQPDWFHRRPTRNSS